MTLTTVTDMKQTTKSKAAPKTLPPASQLNLTTQMPPVSGYPIPAEVDPLLVDILSWRREHGSKHESDFVKWLADEIKRVGLRPTYMTTENNLVVEVPRPDTLSSTTLFSCHTDTCHRNADGKPRKQKVSYDGQRGEVFLTAEGAQAWDDCLGADDGAGVWLMLKMIQAKVPGTYVFHRGEERGCIGSSAMARQEADWLKKFDLAVAFDRKGFTEIITHQGGGKRCASDKCATALQTQLHKHGLKNMVLSDKGALTDTLKYRTIIAECFNLAVGYHLNHGPSEYVDYAYLAALCNALVRVDWDALPVDRDLTALPPPPPAFPKAAPAKPTKPAKPAKPAAAKFDLAQEFMDMTYEDLSDYIQSFPEEAIGDINQLVIELIKTRAERDLYKNRGGF